MKRNILSELINRIFFLNVNMIFILVYKAEYQYVTPPRKISLKSETLCSNSYIDNSTLIKGKNKFIR